LNGTVLRVDGTAKSDTIRVVQTNKLVSVSDAGSVVKINGLVAIAASKVTEIVVDAKDGNDSVNMEGVTIVGKLFGGLGDDTLTGGKNRDFLYGNTGNDSLNGRENDDVLDGGKGVDEFFDRDGFNSFREEDFKAVIGGCAPTDIEQKAAPLCVTYAALAEAAQQRLDLGSLIARSGSNWTIDLPGRERQVVFFDGTWNDYDPQPQRVSGVPEVWPLLLSRARLQSYHVRTDSLKTDSQWETDHVASGRRLFDPEAALADFTAASATSGDTKSTTAAAVQQLLAKGKLVLLGSDEGASDFTANEVVRDHAYALLRVYQQGNAWYADLFNPWHKDAIWSAVGPKGSRGAASAGDGIVTLSWDVVRSDLPTLVQAELRDVFPGAPVAQGKWNSIYDDGVAGHTLVRMRDGKVLDWVPATGSWRLWNYDAASTKDVLPGNPVAQGKWNSIRAGHRLIVMSDGRVLDWVPANGTWRLWNYDPTSTKDIFPGNPVAQGKWSSITSGHDLVVMKDGRVLDWQSSGSWRLWNYDPASTKDVLPGNPVPQGKWSSISAGHTLIRMRDGRVLDWVPGSGSWRLWDYDPASTKDILPGSAVAQGRWSSIGASHRLVLMSDGHVLDWASNGSWRLWNYSFLET